MIVYSGIGGSPYRARGILHFIAMEDSAPGGVQPSEAPEKEAERFRDAAAALAKSLDEYYKTPFCGWEKRKRRFSRHRK